MDDGPSPSETATGDPGAGPPPPAHPWDGFLTGPENALAARACWPWRGARRRGSRRWWCTARRGWASRGCWRGWSANGCRVSPGAAVAHLEAEAFAAACAEAAGRRGGGWAELRAPLPHPRPVRARGHARHRARPPGPGRADAHPRRPRRRSGRRSPSRPASRPGQWPAWPTRLVNRLIGGLAVADRPARASPRAGGTCSRAPGRAAWRCRPRPSTPWPRPPTATAPSTAGWPGWRLEPPASDAAAGLDLAAVTAILAEEAELAAAGRTIDRGRPRRRAAVRRPRLRDLRGPRRQASVVEPRHLAMRLARLHTGLSFAGHRRLLRRPRPGDRPPRLQGRRRADRRRPLPGGGRRRASASRRRGPTPGPTDRWHGRG